MPDTDPTAAAVEVIDPSGIGVGTATMARFTLKSGRRRGVSRAERVAVVRLRIKGGVT